MGPPPAPPAPKPSKLTDAWRTQARKFASYFLILYRPWKMLTEDGGTLPGSTTWSDFCSFMHSLGEGNNNGVTRCLNRVRSKWIHHAAHGLRMPGSDQTAVSKWRYECADRWNVNDNQSLAGVR